jgi:hypothetical protein
VRLAKGGHDPAWERGPFGALRDRESDGFLRRKIYGTQLFMAQASRPSQETGGSKRIPAGSPPGSEHHFNGSVAASAAAAARSAATTTTTAAALTGLGFVHLEGTAVKVLAIQRLHGASGIRIRHFNESKSTGTPGITVRDERQRLDSAVRRKQRPDRVFGRGEGKIADK